MGFFKRLFGGTANMPEEESESKAEKDFEVLKGDGVRAMRMGQLPYAVRCFQSALELKGASADDEGDASQESREVLEVRDCLSMALIHMGELDAALKQLNKLVDAEPDNKDIYVRIAQVCGGKDDYVAMADACEKAMAIDNNDPFLYYLYAQACKGKYDFINAIALLTKSISVSESCGDAQRAFTHQVQARLLRGNILMEMKELNEADEDAQWLVENVAEPSEDILLFKARVMLSKGEFDEALVYYNKVIEVNPFSSFAFRERGAVYMQKGDKENAEKDLRTFLEMNPQFAEAMNGEFQAEGKEHCHS